VGARDARFNSNALASLEVVSSRIARAVVHIETNIMAEVVGEKSGDGLVTVRCVVRA
jgi:hypothetical protein